MSALGDLGPVLRSRADLRPIAVEAHQLALILLDTTAEGGDVARANRILDRLRAVVGSPPQTASGE
ncbi:MAG: hypothetical protein ACK4PC_03480 [Sphingopyxis sp.]